MFSDILLTKISHTVKPRVNMEGDKARVCTLENEIQL